MTKHVKVSFHNKDEGTFCDTVMGDMVFRAIIHEDVGHETVSVYAHSGKGADRPGRQSQSRQWLGDFSLAELGEHHRYEGGALLKFSVTVFGTDINRGRAKLGMTSIIWETCPAQAWVEGCRNRATHFTVHVFDLYGWPIIEITAEDHCIEFSSILTRVGDLKLGWDDETYINKTGDTCLGNGRYWTGNWNKSLTDMSETQRVVVKAMIAEAAAQGHNRGIRIKDIGLSNLNALARHGYVSNRRVGSGWGDICDLNPDASDGRVGKMIEEARKLRGENEAWAARVPPPIIYVIAKEEDGHIVLKEDQCTDFTESFKYAAKWDTEAQAVSDMEDTSGAYVYKMERIDPATESDY